MKQWNGKLKTLFLTQLYMLLHLALYVYFANYAHTLINGWGYEAQGGKSKQGIVGVAFLFDWHPHNISFQWFIHRHLYNLNWIHNDAHKKRTMNYLNADYKRYLQLLDAKEFTRLPLSKQLMVLKELGELEKKIARESCDE